MSENGTASEAQKQHQRVSEALQRIVQPVKDEVELIDARLAELDAERHELSAARQEAMKVLRAADPTFAADRSQGPKKKPKTAITMRARAHERAQRNADRIEALLREQPNGNSEGVITRKWISEQLDDLGMEGARSAIELLVEAGVLRADHTVRGGGIAYALVS